MSEFVPPRPTGSFSEQRFAIVASEFNRQFVDPLVEHASAELRALAPDAQIEIFRVPGAFEIPVVASELAHATGFGAILAVGVIIRGETAHAEHLARSVTDALQQIATHARVPVINA